MKTKIASVLAVLALANVAVAETDGFKISGDFAASYFREDGKGGNGEFPTAGAIGNLENDGNFSVDMVEINVEKGVGNSTFVMGLGFGRIFDSINYVADSNVDVATGVQAPRSGLNLTNAYFGHKFGDTGLSLKLGKFESFMGHETYNYMDNMNYTRGYAFYYTMPFYLTGLNVNYAINEMFDVGVYAANTTAASDVDDNRNKVLGASVNIKPMEGLGIKLNYLAGTEGGDRKTNPAFATTENTLEIMNAIVTYSMNNMDFAVQWVNRTTEPVAGGTEAEASVIGLYAGYKADMWGAGLRYEMADYDAGSAMDVGTGLAGLTTPATDNTINTFTLSGWYDIDQNARLKLDIAQHSSDEKAFVDDDGAEEDSIMVYGLGLAYRF